MKCEKFSGDGENGNIFHGVSLKNASLSQGGWTPLSLAMPSWDRRRSDRMLCFVIRIL